MVFPRFAAVGNEGHLHAFALADQVVVETRYREHHRDRCAVRGFDFVAHDDQRRAAVDRGFGRFGEGAQSCRKREGAAAGLERRFDDGRRERRTRLQQPQHLTRAEDRRGATDLARCAGALLQQRAPRAYHHLE